MSEANKALVRRWFAELDRGNDYIVDELVAIDYIDHNPPLPDMAPGRGSSRPMPYCGLPSQMRGILINDVSILQTTQYL